MSYKHPTTVLEFESVYRKEYAQELKACDQWVKWCEKNYDTHGMNFHQGMRAALVFHHHKMEQLLRVLKQEEPNKAVKDTPAIELDPLYPTTYLRVNPAPEKEATTKDVQ